MPTLKDLLGRTTPVGKTHGLLEYLGIMERGLAGDMVLAVSPATTSSSAAAVTATIGGSVAKYTRSITIKLQTATGEVHEWFQGTFAIAASKTGSGTLGIAGGLTSATFVDGVAAVTLEYTGTWEVADTATLTITGGTKLGYTISNKTSVDTIVA
ncbi:hypothetical protein [Paenibacillus ferrarius]|uniref:hypothetical protein n=1 Tax=Paenibacillus ferrarius TaxID=1469647 RepID=UPI003D2E1A7C